MKKKLLLILFLLLSLLGLFLFTNPIEFPAVLSPLPFATPDTETFIDIEFFEDNNCESSCWQGLITGQSTIDDIATYFDHNVNYHDDAFMREVAERNLMVSSGLHADGYSIQVYVRNELLLGILLFGSFDLTYEEIIAVLDSPPYVQLVARSNSSYEPVIILRLFYPANGYVFDIVPYVGMNISDVDSEHIEICTTEEMYVKNIHIVESGNIGSMVNDIRPVLFPNLYDNNSFINQLHSDFRLGCYIVELQ